MYLEFGHRIVLLGQVYLHGRPSKLWSFLLTKQDADGLLIFVDALLRDLLDLHDMETASVRRQYHLTFDAGNIFAGDIIWEVGYVLAEQNVAVPDIEHFDPGVELLGGWSTR